MKLNEVDTDLTSEINEILEEHKLRESATASSTAAGNIATVASVPGAYRKIKRGKNKLPKAPQALNPDGTAKNAVDTDINLMGSVIKR